MSFSYNHPDGVTGEAVSVGGNVRAIKLTKDGVGSITPVGIRDDGAVMLYVVNSDKATAMGISLDANARLNIVTAGDLG